MKIKKGMTVGIRAICEGYGGRLAGKTGVVTLPVCNSWQKVGVLVDGVENPGSKYGYYYFYENELYPIKSNSKQVDKGDSLHPFAIKNVYFNDPVTVVMWQDGTKTIVRCGENDTYDPEMGLAMAISKKALGNKGNYYNQFRKWLPKEKYLCDSCKIADINPFSRFPVCVRCLLSPEGSGYESKGNKK